MNIKHLAELEATSSYLTMGRTSQLGRSQEVRRLYLTFSAIADVPLDVGGENAPDHVRGPYNEGGWWFERVGA